MSSLRLAVLAMALMSAAPAFASPITLDFEGANDYGSVLEFYNGGTDQSGNSGTNYGVSFGGDALGLVNDGLGSGVGGAYFSNAPTPGTVMTVVGASDAAMNVANGFTGTASFYYSASQATSINIYSGPQRHWLHPRDFLPCRECPGERLHGYGLLRMGSALRDL